MQSEVEWVIVSDFPKEKKSINNKALKRSVDKQKLNWKRRTMHRKFFLEDETREKQNENSSY